MNDASTSLLALALAVAKAATFRLKRCVWGVHTFHYAMPVSASWRPSCFVYKWCGRLRVDGCAGHRVVGGWLHVAESLR